MSQPSHRATQASRLHKSAVCMPQQIGSEDMSFAAKKPEATLLSLPQKLSILLTSQPLEQLKDMTWLCTLILQGTFPCRRSQSLACYQRHPLACPDPPCFLSTQQPLTLPLLVSDGFLLFAIPFPLVECPSHTLHLTLAEPPDTYYFSQALPRRDPLHLLSRVI